MCIKKSILHFAINFKMCYLHVRNKIVKNGNQIYKIDLNLQTEEEEEQEVEVIINSHLAGDLLCRNATQPRANINEAKEYFHRAIQNGRQIESHQKLALIYKEENNFPKAIEMLEHSLQYINLD